MKRARFKDPSSQVKPQTHPSGIALGLYLHRDSRDPWGIGDIETFRVILALCLSREDRRLLAIYTGDFQ